ncbi:peptide deformylase [Sulfurospirillum arcachonense]|uniref:peptide deformylase n=1 Tax=Sulfurospirillum arcachonense TaxID=57666 RepID=UPI00046A260E|nr:peptide deformylase [Sulfurospirillum arcachonense]
MVREILVYPDKRLKVVSKDVINFDKELHKLLEDMKETMYANEGIGLAAIQIGVAQNVLVINLANEEGEQDPANLVEIINPVILESEGSITYQEGCLSVPSFYEDVERKENIKVRYFDRLGLMIEKELDGLMAIAFQHELDHLNGHLFIEKLSFLKRKKFEKEWKKKLKERK